MTTAVPMPARGECAAPTFDSAKIRELPRFFSELEYLFKRAHLTSESEKKKHILRYVNFNTEQMWKIIPEFSDSSKKYDDFKDAILAHYPDAIGDSIYSLRDMDLLIAEHQRIGITISADLADYHLKFTTITQWLFDKKHLGELEQECAYLRAFQPRFLSAILNRLQIKFPDHSPLIPYKVKDVYDAARFVLQAATMTQAYSSSLSTSPYLFQPATVEPEPSAKAEDFGSLFKALTKTVLEALNHNSSSNIAQERDS